MLEGKLKILIKKRETCEENVLGLYEGICSIADGFDTGINFPRLARRQNNCANYPCDNAMDYYRLSIYIPIVRDVIKNSKSRFPDKL